MIADEPTLSRLMAAAQRGDRPFYAALLQLTERWLQRYFSRKVPPAQLDDLVQEVLMALHSRRASYDPTRPFLPWLAAIARYRWVDHLRRVYRAAEQTMLDDEISVPCEEEAVLARISIDRLLSALPPGQAKAIALVRIEGHSISEAAKRSGQSEPLVKVNIHRGLKKLASLIEMAD